MQSVSMWFAETAQQQGRQLVTRVYVQWDDATWTDESDYLESHTGSLRFGAPGEELTPPGDVGDATIVLQNFGRFEEAGTLAAYIGGPAGLFGKRVRLEVGFRAFGGNSIVEELVCVFTGVIYNWTPGTKLTLQCRDMGYAYMQHKTSCTIRVSRRADQLIADYADLASVPAGARVLDTSSFVVPWGWLDDEGVVEEMWEVARAEGARIYFDQLGRLRFETVQHWACHATPDLVLDASYRELREQPSPDALATSITVEWAGRYVGAETVLYTLEESKVIRPGETLEFEARFSHPCLQYSALAASDYKIVSVGGVDMAGSMTVSLPSEQRFAQRCTVRLSNSHTNLAATVIFLQIRGYPLLGGPTEQVTVQAAVPPTPWLRNRNLRGNMYMQTWEQAVTQAQFLAGRYQRLTRVATLTDLPGLPQLELGDRVRWLESKPEFELLANTSFESNTSGWAITSYGPLVTRTSGYGAIDGAYALLADFTPAGTNAYALVLSTAVPCTPGDIYGLTGWCKQIWSAFSAAQGVDVGLRFLDSGGNVVQDNLSAAAADEGNWVAFSTQYSAPAGANQVQAYLQPYAANGGGTGFKALLDGLSLCRVGAYREGFVIGLSWRYAADHGYRQTLQLLDATQLYPHADYFVIGETALGAAGRAWY